MVHLRWSLAILLAAFGACRPSADREPASMPSAAAPAPAGTRGAGLSEDFRAATANVYPAVVRIDVSERSRTVAYDPSQQPALPFFGVPDSVETPPQGGTGSGFVFDSTGLVLTNRHVIADADRLLAHLSDGREFDATVVGSDANTDLAVIRLRLPAGVTLPTAALGESGSVDVGDWVLAVGSPLGLDFSVTAGIVSAKGRSIGILEGQGTAPLEAYIQTDAAINPGNSGGPLVDLGGRVIGINAAIESPTGVYAGYGFAIPIDVARKVASDLLRYGRVHRPRLGVQVGDANAADAQVFSLPAVSGAVIRSLEGGTAAGRAGLRMGDVVVSLDDHPIDNAADLTTALAEMEPGRQVKLGVIRYGARQDVTVQLEEFKGGPPAEAAKPAAPAADPLGFEVGTLTPSLARQAGIPVQHGLVITDVDPLSPAAEVGIQPGLLLRSISGNAVATPDDVDRIRRGLKPGNAVSLIVGTPARDFILNFIVRE